MQVSTVRYKDLNHEFRIDAEYYREEVLNRLNILEEYNSDFLENLVDFLIGPFGSTVTVDKYVEKSNYKYVRNKDINDFRIRDDELALVPEDIYNSLSKFHITENDLLITVVGTLGKVAIATKEDTKSIFSCKSTVIRTRKVNPFYLLVYLNSETGKMFSLRGKRGAIQEGLNLTDLKEIKVFVPSANFQGFIENIVRKSFTSIDHSKILFTRSKTILLRELGLFDWQPKHQLSFVKRYSDTEQTGRLDAEYYQPKYEEIIKAIKNYSGGWNTLGNLVNIKDKNITPKERQLYKYIELANIGGNGEITDCMIEEGQSLPSRARRKVMVGDVIVSSIEGSLSSIALVDKNFDNALCSTGFYIINSKTLNSETLLVFLKSMLGQLQLKKGCSGTILTAINKDEIKKVVLPKISATTQTQIQQKVTESFDLRRKSKHLLECAKRAVEIAIEKNEQIAVTWLNEQVREY